MNSRLGREFFLQSSTELAPSLLGKVLCLRDGDLLEEWRIVEVESYCGIIDKAAHTYNNRRTARTETLYLAGGHLYVYFIYGMYYMMNIVANKKDIPEGVLIRALEPLGKARGDTNGPGKLCRALGITKAYNGLDLCSSKKLFLREGNREEKIITSKRINIGYAEEDQDKLWRFFLQGNSYVSKR